MVLNNLLHDSLLSLRAKVEVDVCFSIHAINTTYCLDIYSPSSYTTRRISSTERGRGHNYQKSLTYLQMCAHHTLYLSAAYEANANRIRSQDHVNEHCSCAHNLSAFLTSSTFLTDLGSAVFYHYGIVYFT